MHAMHSEICHNLEANAVRNRLDSMLDQIRADYADMVNDLESDWEGDTLHISFTAYGFEIASDFRVGPERIEWEGHVPPRATLFRSKIQRTINGKLTESLR